MRSRLCLALSGLLLLLALTGCEAEQTPVSDSQTVTETADTAEESASAETEPAAETDSAAETESASETETESASETEAGEVTVRAVRFPDGAWQGIYRSFLEEDYTAYFEESDLEGEISFGLLDLDDDAVPELLLYAADSKGGAKAAFFRCGDKNPVHLGTLGEAPMMTDGTLAYRPGRSAAGFLCFNSLERSVYLLDFEKGTDVRFPADLSELEMEAEDIEEIAEEAKTYDLLLKIPAFGGSWTVLTDGSAADALYPLTEESIGEWLVPETAKPLYTNENDYDGWRDAYRHFLEDGLAQEYAGTSDSLSFSLLYLDEDDVPELLVHHRVTSGLLFRYSQETGSVYFVGEMLKGYYDYTYSYRPFEGVISSGQGSVMYSGTYTEVDVYADDGDGLHLSKRYGVGRYAEDYGVTVLPEELMEQFEVTEEHGWGSLGGGWMSDAAIAEYAVTESSLSAAFMRY